MLILLDICLDKYYCILLILAKFNNTHKQYKEVSMTLVFEVNASTDIPSSLIIIERNKYDNLLKSSLKGRWWTLNDVMQHISISQKTLSDKVLNNPKFQ